MQNLFLFMLMFLILNCPLQAETDISINDIAIIDSTIWVATDQGVFSINPATDKVTYIREGASCIGQAPDGSIWVVGSQLQRYYGNTWQVLDEPALGLTPDWRWSFGGITTMAFDGADVWLASMFTVFHYNGISTVPYYDLDWFLWSSPPIMDIVIGPEGTAWTVGWVGLVHYLSDGTMIEDTRFQLGSGRKILIDKDGSFKIATRSGLWVINGDSKQCFNKTNSGIPSDYVADCVFDSTGTLWLLTGHSFDSNTCLTSFDGSNWTVYPESEMVIPFGPTCLGIDVNGDKWIGTMYQGLYKFDGNSIKQIPLTGAIPVSVENPAPSSFRLHPTYPNPFNASTTISFTLQKTNFVTISVYSVTGKKIATLLEQTMNAGTHHITFDGANLPSGLYFCRIETAGQVKTGKLLLVK